MKEAQKRIEQALDKLPTAPEFSLMGRKGIYSLLGGTVIFRKWPSIDTAFAFATLCSEQDFDDYEAVNQGALDFITTLITAVTGLQHEKSDLSAGARGVLETDTPRIIVSNQHGIRIFTFKCSYRKYPGQQRQVVGFEVAPANAKGAILFSSDMSKVYKVRRSS